MEKAKIEISEVSMSVYKKIAQWHNGDKEEPNVQNLALLSNEIVELVLAEAFNQDVNANNIGIEMGPDAQKNMMEAFMKSQGQEEEPNKKGLFGLFGKK